LDIFTTRSVDWLVVFIKLYFRPVFYDLYLKDTCRIKKLISHPNPQTRVCESIGKVDFLPMLSRCM